jgi:hypothetical protein
MVNRRRGAKYQRPRGGFWNPDGSIRLKDGLRAPEPWLNAPRKVRKRQLLAPPSRRREADEQ